MRSTLSRIAGLAERVGWLRLFILYMLIWMFVVPAGLFSGCWSQVALHNASTFILFGAIGCVCSSFAFLHDAALWVKNGDDREGFVVNAGEFISRTQKDIPVTARVKLGIVYPSFFFLSLVFFVGSASTVLEACWR